MDKVSGFVAPEGVKVEAGTGGMTPCTNHYERRLGQMAGIYLDADAYDALLKSAGDVVTYEVYEYVPSEADGDVIFGTSILHPGKVGDEYFMTRGHSHAKADRAEIYYALAGEGLMLMESPDGQTKAVGMRAGTIVYVPPHWTHRSVNTGGEKLISVFAYPADAGHEYGELARKGMRKIVTEVRGKPEVRDNPAYAD